MLYLIGLGLGDVTDVTLKGFNLIKKCDKVFLEGYTSLLLSSSVDDLENFYGKSITVADREFVENNVDDILEPAVDGSVCFLVVGDPLGATTHSDIILRAVKRNISYQVMFGTTTSNIKRK